MSVYIIYRSTADGGRGYGDTQWGAYTSLESARSAILNHSDHRWEMYYDIWFYEEYELDVCEEHDSTVIRQPLFNRDQD